MAYPRAEQVIVCEHRCAHVGARARRHRVQQRGQVAVEQRLIVSKSGEKQGE